MNEPTVNKVLQDLSALSYSHRHFTTLAGDATIVITTLQSQNERLVRALEELLADGEYYCAAFQCGHCKAQTLLTEIKKGQG